ncbi:OmpA family protein [Chryseosolibacter indicus]|uniref:PD40 domain-containing protein n=1 Tax=Chryseosolibacter indicus TaxID=2782351 RepID=A0ABS5W0E5_9BACT|nr:OmpA family protein [Chryseosolibacter indicus]MBT1705751.1 PD40 domain-containing protein [Chryseosolibacter indicus]
MRKVVTIFLFLLVNCVWAQDFKSLMDKGDKLIAKKDYENALKIYENAYNLASDNAEVNFKLGLCYLHSEKKSRSVPYLERAYRSNAEIDADIDYHLGMAYQYDHQYSKASHHYNEFKTKNKKLAHIADNKIAECVTGDSLSKHPAYVVLENLGGDVNSIHHDYSPLVSSDGSTLIFTSNRSTDEYKLKSGTNYEDIYISTRQGDSWSIPQKISSNINAKYNDAAASLSHDGKTLFLYYEEGAGDIYVSKLEGSEWTKPVPLNRNINTPLFWETSACISADGKKLYFTSNRPGGKGELDIYVSELDSKGEWGRAVNLGPTINTRGNEDSPFIHSDGVTLFFSSDGHPTMGSNDIFKSEFKDGKWTRPINMGHPINSIEYDGFFTLSDDKKTGYFSAMREDGLGNADLYRIRFVDPPKQIQRDVIPETAPVIADVKKEETKPVESPVVQPQPATVTASQETQPIVVATTQETKPVELPQETKSESPPVAEPKSEVAQERKSIDPPIVQEIKPQSAALAKAEAETRQDQFIDPIIEEHKNKKIVTVLKGKVIDELSSAPLPATITLVDNETNRTISRIKANTETGDFELVIPHGGNYGVATEVSGYLFNSINFSVPQFAEYQEIDTHILMVKAEVGSKVVLKNIFFDTGKADLRAESLSELENIRELLIANPHLKVQINGHTDNTGNAATNVTLSLNRAEAVVNYLIDKGIDTSRLSAKGFGSERPLVSNDDEQEGREINRRTEIEIIEATRG